MDAPLAAPSQERWALIEPLLDRVLDTPADSRAGFLSDARLADPALCDDIEWLLQASEASDAFFEQPALAYASPLVDWVAERQAMASGDWVGPYLIEGRLGQGGMATVYLAHDPRHGRRVALKLLRPEVSGALGTERFAREIGIAARLSHPRILPLYDSGTVERLDSPPLVFYTMPYIVGCSLRDRLREQHQLPVPEAVEIARQVASALEYAHREGVVHRDIKPENILLADGEARVADFGIARALDVAGEDRLTDAGIVIGTPAYMSPEQATGSGHLDGRADQYALACVLYEMLAGEPPFTGSTSQAVLARHATDPVPSLRTVRPGVSPDLARVITQALAKVAADRFPSVGAFADALAAPHPGAAEIERSGGRSPSRSRRRIAAAVAAGGLALSALFALRTHADRRAVAALDPALVAVAPFRVAAADSTLDYLHEGMVDLLAAKLQVEAGVRPVDPRSTLSTWRRLVGPEARDVAPDAPLRLARGLRAGRVIDGSIVGAGHDLTLSASLLRSADAKVVAIARVEGPIDSLSVLLDRLAARLLTLEAGVVPSRLSAMSTSLPAIRAFLAGRAAFRLGELGEAFRQFRDATLLDSTFALAAFELVHVSLWLDWGDDARRGLRLAEAGRSRLSRDDVALLDAWPLITRFPTAPELLERWRVAAEAFPGRADIWYWFGDAYYHAGRSLGLEDRLDLALQAFRRGWALDSANTMHSLTALRSPQFVEPLNHMVEIAQMKADTASVLRLTRLGLSADSTGEWGWYLRWHRAAVSGESVRRAFWADSERIDPRAIRKVSDFITANGVGSQDWLRAIRLDTRNQEGSRPGMIAQSHAVALLNGGRPHETRQVLQPPDDTTWDGLGRVADGLYWDLGRVAGALYWDQDTSGAEAAVHRFATLGRGPMRPGRAGMSYLRALCITAIWRVERGRLEPDDQTVERLRRAVPRGVSAWDSVRATQYATVCAALLDAMQAVELHRPDASVKLSAADEAARTYNLIESVPVNLIVARLWEATGNLPLALRAVRRRSGDNGPKFQPFLSTFLREEGRLAILAGDTVGAIRAYRHFLMLRPDPEPELRWQSDQVRAELRRLETLLDR